LQRLAASVVWHVIGVALLLMHYLVYARDGVGAPGMHIAFAACQTAASLILLNVFLR
jgi:hypothetical protein